MIRMIICFDICSSRVRLASSPLLRFSIYAVAYKIDFTKYFLVDATSIFSICLIDTLKRNDSKEADILVDASGA